MSASPIFIGGQSRSGKTYLRFILSAHPEIIISRRTNLWTQHYHRYDRLDRAENLERCLRALAKSRHIQSLGIDFDQLRRDFLQGDAGYEQLFALIHAQYAANQGKSRWGDQTEGLEKMAPVILTAFPDARFVHLIRDPRDRYQAVLEKNHVSDTAMRLSLRGNSLGAATAQWLSSAALAISQQQRYPRQYKVVRYESLVSRPAETVKGICDFIGEEYSPRMIEMQAEKRFTKRVEQEDGGLSPLSVEFIGRFRQSLTPFEIGFIQRRSKELMEAFCYLLEPVDHNRVEAAISWLFSTVSLLGWQVRDLAARE